MPVGVVAGLVPAIHVVSSRGSKAWMPGTRPGMTSKHHFVSGRNSRTTRS